RLILGTDEESGWECIRYYLSKEERPALAFSPDAEFPVIHGEKGILTFALKKNLSSLKSEKIESLEIEGGNAPNMVPDYCQAIIGTDYLDLFRNALEEYRQKIPEVKIDLEEKDGKLLIKSHGVSAHGSLPEDGYNATSQLMAFLAVLDIYPDELQGVFRFYRDKIGMEYNGESLDRKNTRLNSSHLKISYAVFCLKKKNKESETRAPAISPLAWDSALLLPSTRARTLCAALLLAPSLTIRRRGQTHQ